MKISSFTAMQLELFRKSCNFTELESQCFELKAKDKTDVQLAFALNVSESTIAVTMRKVRSKIDDVLRHNIKKSESPLGLNTCDRGCPNMVYHTMLEWSKIPDFLTTKGTMYIYADYRTENIDGEEINIPRIKFGDGVHSISDIPFATMSITDKDMSYWDGKCELDSEEIKDEIYINKKLVRYTFPMDGYLTLEFESASDYASVGIYRTNGKKLFTFEKLKGIDIHSKEVFVRKGTKCEYIDSSKNAVIKFVPLV